MGYYSAIKRKEAKSVLGRWMNLEPLIQSEVSQKEKNKHRINTYIWNPEKRVLMNPFAEQERGCRLGEQTCGYDRERLGWDDFKELQRNTRAVMCEAV